MITIQQDVRVYLANVRELPHLTFKTEQVFPREYSLLLLFWWGQNSEIYPTLLIRTIRKSECPNRDSDRGSNPSPLYPNVKQMPLVILKIYYCKGFFYFYCPRNVNKYLTILPVSISSCKWVTKLITPPNAVVMLSHSCAWSRIGNAGQGVDAQSACKVL